MRGLLGLLLVMAATWLAVPVTVEAGATSVTGAITYTYDTHYPESPADCTTTERGLPASNGPRTNYDAGDPRWCGASPRPDGLAPSTITTYDDSVLFVQLEPTTATTPEQVLRTSEDSLPLAQPGVAANAVRPSVTDARLGRALADDFRGGPNPIGDGSALDAARHTVDTGQLVGGSTHLEKAVEMRDRYARVLRRGGLSSADEAVAQGRYDAYSSFVIENDLDAMMRARGLR